MIKIYPPLHENYPITQIFGENAAAYAKFGLKGHNGIDWGCPQFTAVYAAADGVVIDVGYDVDGYGNYIKLMHDGYTTLYAHLSQPKVSKNDKVIVGQYIGQSGNTGFSTGAHLHFELRINGQEQNGYYGAVDPLPYLAGNQAPETTEKPVISVGDIVQVVATDGLRVREKPTTASETLCVSKPGRQFDVVKVIDDGDNVWLGVVVYVAGYYDGEVLARKV